MDDKKPDEKKLKDLPAGAVPDDAAIRGGVKKIPPPPPPPHKPIDGIAGESVNDKHSEEIH